MFLSDSSLLQTHVLKSIDSRFQNLCGWAGGNSISRNPCLPLTRKVAKPQVLSEGEIPYLSNFDALPVLRQGFSPSVGFADSSPIRWSQGTKLFRIRSISMEALNLWAFMRGFAVRSNRTETQNPCPLSLWGHGFVFYNTAVAGSGHSPHAESTTLELMGTWIRLL